MDAIKNITGTWFDFRHQSAFDGNYWNGHTAKFTARQWEVKVQEMTGLGMETLVLMAVAVEAKPFYPSKVLKERWELACPDPLEAVLSAADKHQARVYLGVGFFHKDFGDAKLTEDTKRVNREVILELAERYGRHASFYGWYLPVEEGIDGHYSETYLEYANTLSRYCRTTGSRKVLIAPYGTRRVIPDGKFVDQLKSLEVDYFAYQDEIGVEKTKNEELEQIYANLKKVHDQAGKPLWADTEVFRFEGKVYESPLLPAPMERIEDQLRRLSPFCEKILCYQYLGLMNPPGSEAHTGHPSTVKLYEDYSRWLKKLKK